MHACTRTQARTHAHTLGSVLGRNRVDRRCVMMYVLLFAPLEDLSAEWTEGQRRAPVNWDFTFYCVVSSHPTSYPCLTLWFEPLEDLGPLPPFPSAPAPPWRPQAAGSDRRRCRGDGWLCAEFQCQSVARLLPAVCVPVSASQSGQLSSPLPLFRDPPLYREKNTLFSLVY